MSNHRLCPDCLERYPADQVRCAKPQHSRLLDISDVDDPRIGTLIDGRYLVLGRLGEGAMGVVYRAWQRSTAREVAVKVLPVEPSLQANNPREYNELRARFRREVQLAARIDSAFVARVHDSGELPDGGLYFAMERVIGTTLDRVLLTEGRLAPSRVLRLGAQLGQALGVVHALGLVHRDVKPGNIMVVKGLDGRESLKLVDFGIARAFEVDVQMGRAALTNLTVAGTLIGSFAYMAPEQISSGPGGKRGNVGPWSDIYGAGVTLFELVTGGLPYSGPTAPAFAYQHQSAPIPSALKLLGDDEDLALGGLDRLLNRMLAKDPSDRFQDGTALAAAIADVERRISLAPTDRVAGSYDATTSYGPDDTHPEDVPAGEVVGRMDPGTIRGISTGDVLARAASTTSEVRAPRGLSAGRLAFGVACVLALVTVLWDVLGTLPR